MNMLTLLIALITVFVLIVVFIVILLRKPSSGDKKKTAKVNGHTVEEMTSIVKVKVTHIVNGIEQLANSELGENLKIDDKAESMAEVEIDLGDGSEVRSVTIEGPEANLKNPDELLEYLKTQELKIKKPQKTFVEILDDEKQRKRMELEREEETEEQERMKVMMMRRREREESRRLREYVRQTTETAEQTDNSSEAPMEDDYSNYEDLKPEPISEEDVYVENPNDMKYDQSFVDDANFFGEGTYSNTFDDEIPNDSEESNETPVNKQIDLQNNQEVSPEAVSLRIKSFFNDSNEETNESVSENSVVSDSNTQNKSTDEESNSVVQNNVDQSEVEQNPSVDEKITEDNKPYVTEPSEVKLIPASEYKQGTLDFGDVPPEIVNNIDDNADFS